jgi:hypothetical protein
MEECLEDRCEVSFSSFNMDRNTHPAISALSHIDDEEKNLKEEENEHCIRERIK